MLGRLAWSAKQCRWCSNQFGLDEATETNKDTVDAYASSLQLARCLGNLSDHVLNHAIMHAPAALVPQLNLPATGGQPKSVVGRCLPDAV